RHLRKIMIDPAVQQRRAREVYPVISILFLVLDLHELIENVREVHSSLNKISGQEKSFAVRRNKGPVHRACKDFLLQLLDFTIVLGNLFHNRLADKSLICLFCYGDLRACDGENCKMVNSRDKVHVVLDVVYLLKRLQIKDVSLFYLQHDRCLVGSAKVLGIEFMDFHVWMVLGEKVEELSEHFHVGDLQHEKTSNESHADQYGSSEFDQERNEFSKHFVPSSCKLLDLCMNQTKASVFHWSHESQDLRKQLKFPSWICLLRWNGIRASLMHFAQSPCEYPSVSGFPFPHASRHRIIGISCCTPFRSRPFELSGVLCALGPFIILLLIHS